MDRALFDGKLPMTVPDSWEDRAVFTYVAPTQPTQSLPGGVKLTTFRPLARGAASILFGK